MSDTRQNLQMKLDFRTEAKGEAPKPGPEATESLRAASEPESPARTDRLMEVVCERENLKEAVRRVKGQQRECGSGRDDRRPTHRLSETALASHWGTTAGGNLSTEAGETGRDPEAGRRGAQAGHSDGAGSFRSASGDAGSATAVGSDVFQSQLWLSTATVSSAGGGTGATEHLGRVQVGRDLDLEKFFDRVNHDKLMGQIAKRVEDKRLLRVIRAFLSAGVMENGLVSPSVEGTPQGGPLSPLLSNLVLDELDRELERRGHRFVRYADDGNIYVRSERAGRRVMESITRFITEKLKLKVNEAKSAVARPQQRKFLGFSFTDGRELRRAIASKALDRFKGRIREITCRAKGVSIEATVEELARYMVGWRGYFGFCETPEVLVYLTRWVR